jgi:hypothetical protein
LTMNAFNFLFADCIIATHTHSMHQNAMKMKKQQVD